MTTAPHLPRRGDAMRHIRFAFSAGVIVASSVPAFMSMGSDQTTATGWFACLMLFTAGVWVAFTLAPPSTRRPGREGEPPPDQPSQGA